LKDGNAPAQVTVYPRADNRVRLADFKVALGAVGLKKGMSVEIYRNPGGWTPLRWDTPLLVLHAGQAIVVKLHGVNNLVGWREHAPHVIDGL